MQRKYQADCLYNQHKQHPGAPVCTKMHPDRDCIRFTLQSQKTLQVIACSFFVLIFPLARVCRSCASGFGKF